MGIAWLSPDDPFPDPRGAPAHGLLAAGADLSPARLTAAYRQGIFPWYSEGEPILWWSPDPRMVLACAQVHRSHSLDKLLRQIARHEDTRQSRWHITCDLAFDAVIGACAEPRELDGGTWISPDIQTAYRRWHRHGAVHSVESWLDGQLVGGLYGISIGRFFFGESMFSRHSNASKIALVYLAGFLARHGVDYIDCQQQTGHLGRMGARPLPRESFLRLLHERADAPAPAWRPAQMRSDGRLADPPVLATAATLAP